MSVILESMQQSYSPVGSELEFVMKIQNPKYKFDFDNHIRSLTVELVSETFGISEKELKDKFPEYFI